MVQNLIQSKILNFFWYLFVFACISLINALFIRISLKGSVLMIFPMIAFQNRFTSHRITPF
jgi:surface polysaccharide O-acyltransferase-like enzyme